MAGGLCRVSPALAQRRQLVKPTATLLLGMINRPPTWYRADSILEPDQFADLASDLFLDGLETLAPG